MPTYEIKYTVKFKMNDGSSLKKKGSVLRVGKSAKKVMKPFMSVDNLSPLSDFVDTSDIDLQNCSIRKLNIDKVVEADIRMLADKILILYSKLHYDSDTYITERYECECKNSTATNIRSILISGFSNIAQLEIMLELDGKSVSFYLVPKSQDQIDNFKTLIQQMHMKVRTGGDYNIFSKLESKIIGIDDIDKIIITKLTTILKLYDHPK